VPFLKDIPLLGYLFKSSNVVKEERELLIFVTPRIIRADDV
jgi:type II secretory pathway component HofQ